MKLTEGFGDVVGVGRRGDHGVHQPRFGVDSNVGFNLQVTLRALLGLVPLRVACRYRLCSNVVLRSAWRQL